MTLRGTWDHYVGVLLAELPTVATLVQAQTRERTHAALARSHGMQRQHLLALAHVLRAESAAFSQTLAAALRDQVHAGLHEPANERTDVPGSEPPRRRQALSLSLVDDQQVERDIELARVIQLIESRAEWELRELQALCATLRQARSIRPEHLPLQPRMCASALLSALHQIGLVHEARLLALQLSAQPLADAVRELCAQHCQLLRRRGVPAQNYRMRSGNGRDGALRALANSMMHTDRRSAGLRTAAPESSPAPTANEGLPSELVPRLLEQIADQAEMSAAMRALLARLRLPVARAADAEADALFSFEHPVWRFVDRIASLCSVNDDRNGDRGADGLRALAELLEPIVATLEQAERPDTGVFEEALNRVGSATLRLNSAWLPVAEPAADMTAQPPHAAPTTNAPERASEPDGTPAHEVDAVLRRNVAAQLRGSNAPPAIKQFLLGPWVSVMAHATIHDGARSSQAVRWQDAVAQFIAHADAASRGRLRLPTSAGLIELAEQGMRSASVPAHQLQSSLVELRSVLLHERAPDAADRASSDSGDQPSTVPIDMIATDAETPAKQDRAAWLAALVPGDLCRLFIQGRWMNAQLTWRSSNGQFYVFASGHGGRLHSLTRRQLARLRCEGLAATIERGQQVREAVDTLASDLDAVRRVR